MFLQWRRANPDTNKGVTVMADTRTRSVRPANVNPEIVLHVPADLEVPVQRLAEYVLGSFCITDEGEDDARFYRVNEHTMALAYEEGLIITFNIPSLLALCNRMQTMSDTPASQIYGVEPGDEDDLDNL